MLILLYFLVISGKKSFSSVFPDNVFLSLLISVNFYFLLTNDEKVYCFLIHFINTKLTNLNQPSGMWTEHQLQLEPNVIKLTIIEKATPQIVNMTDATQISLNTFIPFILFYTP